MKRRITKPRITEKRPRWNEGEVEKDKATIIRAILKNREKLLEIDSWLPFPTNACCFSFGKEKRPLPIGVLDILWSKCDRMLGTCPKCYATIYGYAFGGLLSVGGIKGVCIDCDQGFNHSVGGLLVTGGYIGKYLQKTPFYLKGFCFGGTINSPKKPIFEVLKNIGENEIPSDEWAQEQESPGCSLEKFEPQEFEI